MAANPLTTTSTMKLVVVVVAWLLPTLYPAHLAKAFVPRQSIIQSPKSGTPRPFQRTQLLSKAKAPGPPHPLASLDAQELDQSLQKCFSSRQAKNVLDKALAQSSLSSSSSFSPPLFASVSIPTGASARPISDGDLRVQTRLANKKYQIMDLIELSGNRDADRASLTLLCLMVASTGSAIVANQNLPGPEIVRFLVVWMLSFAPLFFVGYGIAKPSKLQALLVSIQRELFPAYRQRMIQHEAGHFLMGHLLGFPIQSYRANAVKNAVALYPLQDTDLGRDRARALGFETRPRRSNQLFEDDDDDDSLSGTAASSFFGPGGRGEEIVQRQSVFRTEKNLTSSSSSSKQNRLSAENEPTRAWPYRGFDDTTLDQLAVISVAGVCAEILAFGNAQGGLADLSQLRQIFGSADREISDREADNRIRYALGYTMTQLRRHLGVLDALAMVMERDGSVAECVLAIETCKNVNGQDGILGDFERRRREQFRKEHAGLLERVFLGSEKNIDQDENRYVGRNGGGYMKDTFRLTGDDPLYAAIAVALAFFVWASSGGLSLH